MSAIKIRKTENSQTFFNFVSTVIRTGVGMITMPIFTRLLGPTQYGHYSVYISWLTIISCFICLNVGSSLGTGYYKFKDKYYQFRSSALIAGTVIATVFILLFTVLQKPILSFTKYTLAIFLLMVTQAFFEYICNFANLSWTYEKQAYRNMIMSVVTLISTTVISIVVVKNWQGNESELYLGRVFGVAFPEIVIGTIVWILLFKEKPYGYNKEYWKYSIAFGFPLVFHTLSQQVLGQSDRIMMEQMGTNGDQIGIYSFIYSFVAIMTTILNALNNSWCPFLYDRLATKKYEELNIKIGNYVQVFSVLTIGFLMLSREVIKIFANSDYWGGAPLIPILSLAVYSTFIYQFAVNYEFFNAKPKIVAMGTVMAAVTNIVLNYVLIPQYGMYGAAFATLISYIALAVLHTIVVKHWKLEKYPFSYKPLVYGSAAILMACILYYLLWELIAVRWIIGAASGVYLLISIKKRKTIF